MCLYPTIDLTATGQNIVRLRKERGLSVKQLQTFFGFDDPQAIYKWQWGKCLPSVDNLYALSILLDVPMNEILVSTQPKLNLTAIGAAGENLLLRFILWSGSPGYSRKRILLSPFRLAPPPPFTRQILPGSIGRMAPLCQIV